MKSILKIKLIISFCLVFYLNFIIKAGDNFSKMEEVILKLSLQLAEEYKKSFDIVSFIDGLKKKEQNELKLNYKEYLAEAIIIFGSIFTNKDQINELLKDKLIFNSSLKSNIENLESIFNKFKASNGYSLGVALKNWFNYQA